VQALTHPSISPADPDNTEYDEKVCQASKIVKKSLFNIVILVTFREILVYTCHNYVQFSSVSVLSVLVLGSHYSK